ncbi:MAG: LamG domain-containing protein [Anaerolineales bacterium]|nr:LamG domain-containing protein [Anaerolineales bacterium]
MRELKLDNLRTTGTTVGDVHFPKVTALLPFDGTNGATSTTDSSNSNHTVTFGGDAEISTAQSKFGGSSLSLDGNGDYVDLPQSTNQLASLDFTVECWFRFNSGAGSNTMGIWGSYYTTPSGKGLWMTHHPPTGNQLYFQVHYGSSGWAYLNQTQGTRTALSNNTWYHAAVTRQGSTWRMFLNGSLEDSMTLNSNVTDSGSTTRLGCVGPSNTNYLNGYIDDFRITKGLARYTSNFTPPTSAHLTQAGDVNKHIVVNSDADGVAIGTGGINQARVAKAWVNFNGTGTVAIRSSYNVSSITDNGTGIYTVNFSSNMTDTNYAVSGSLGSTSASAGWVSNGNNQDSHTVNNTTSSCRVSSAYQSVGGHFDALVLSVNIFGN